MMDKKDLVPFSIAIGCAALTVLFPVTVLIIVIVGVAALYVSNRWKQWVWWLRRPPRK